MDFLTYVQEADKAEWQRAKDQLDAAWERIRDGYDAQNISVHVIISSSWADYGEKDVTLKATDLKSAIVLAQQEFKAVNNRSDVQGRYNVTLFHKGKHYSIPESTYKHLIK